MSRRVASLYPLGSRKEFTGPRTDLGDVIAELASARQKQGMSQRELSRRVQLHPMTVMKLELGRRDLTLTEYLDLAKALELDPVEVLRTALG